MWQAFAENGPFSLLLRRYTHKKARNDDKTRRKEFARAPPETILSRNKKNEYHAPSCLLQLRLLPMLRETLRVRPTASASVHDVAPWQRLFPAPAHAASRGRAAAPVASPGSAKGVQGSHHSRQSPCVVVAAAAAASRRGCGSHGLGRGRAIGCRLC